MSSLWMITLITDDLLVAHLISGIILFRISRDSFVRIANAVE